MQYTCNIHAAEHGIILILFRIMSSTVYHIDNLIAVYTIANEILLLLEVHTHTHTYIYIYIHTYIYIIIYKLKKL